MSNFERWESAGRRGAPKLSVRAQGFMGFNGKAIREFGLCEFPGVVLYFDRETGRIAIEPVKDMGSRGVKKHTIRLCRSSLTSAISARAFCRHFGLLLDRVVSVPVARDPKTGFLVADVSSIVDNFGVTVPENGG